MPPPTTTTRPAGASTLSTFMGPLSQTPCRVPTVTLSVPEARNRPARTARRTGTGHTAGRTRAYALMHGDASRRSSGGTETMPTRSRHVLAAVLLGASLALAGCGSGADGAQSTADRGAAAPPAEGSAADAPGYGGSARLPATGRPVGRPGEGAAQPDRRASAGPQHVIRTAELHIEVGGRREGPGAGPCRRGGRRRARGRGVHPAVPARGRAGRDQLAGRAAVVPQRAYDAALKDLSGAGSCCRGRPTPRTSPIRWWTWRAGSPHSGPVWSGSAS